MTLDGDYRGFEIATRDPGIAVITFNEPDRLNGLSRGMKRDLTEIMTQAQLDTDTRVVVITGSGRGFCAGDDIFNPTENDRHIPTLVPQQVRNVRNSQVDQYALLRAVLAGADPVDPEPRQDHDRRVERRDDPDRVVDRAGVRLPHRLDRCRASGARPSDSGSCPTRVGIGSCSGTSGSPGHSSS